MTETETKAGNFTQNIHLEDYKAQFNTIKIGAESHICVADRPVELLSGCWNFGVDQYDNCLRSRWFEEVYTDGNGRALPLDYSFDQWEIIPVPSCWNLLRERYFLYEGSCVYTRIINFTPGTQYGESERVFLRFGAANTTAYVFLNKEYIGMHTGGYTPFCIEVSGRLKEQNRLLVVVNNTRSPDGVPTDNTDWFNYGGLHRDVSLLRVPQSFIRDFTAALCPDEHNYTKIKVTVSIDGPDNSGMAVVSIPGLDIQREIPVAGGCGEIVIDASSNAPGLWSPDNPRLYDVTLTYGGESITDRIGFRQIAVKDGSILLNGKEIYLRGVCTHEESMYNGNSVTDDEIRENFSIAKDMGCNFMRLAHYPHNEAAARIADEMGIMLWEELPVYWAIAFNNKDTYDNAENQLCELIYRDRNRASVIIWSVGNENADTDARLAFMSKLAQKARQLDPARLISAACMADHDKMMIADRLEQHLDIIGINEYYGWYIPDFSKLPLIFENSRPSKPVVITEFGADAKAGFKGAPGVLCSEENQRDVYEKQIEAIRKIPYVKGTCPWILYDFRCPRRLHHLQDYYNLKGLLSADKKYRKPAFNVMRRYYHSIM